MSKILDSNNFGDKIYGKFPEVYRKDDQYNDYALKRYIQSTGEGFKCAIDELNGISNLRDNMAVPSSLLPIIYSSHGVELFRGLPETFLRNLIPYLNQLLANKGSIKSLEYLCNCVAGIKCEVDLSHFSEDNSVNFIMDMDYYKKDKFPDITQLKRIAKDFVPFYCNVSLVFVYVFFPELTKLKFDELHSDFIEYTTKEKPKIKMVDMLEDEYVVTTKEEYKLVNDSAKENTNFLNDPRTHLNTNIFLNSWNGYDIVTLNGNQTILTYNY